MTEAEKIGRFNDENAPLYIVDLENGRFSLCLEMEYMPEEHRNFGRAAFNRYRDRPDDYESSYGFSYGHEWETVFRKAFSMDDLRLVSVTSDEHSLFCDSHDLDLLENLGSRFKSMCDDTEKFTVLVSDALTEAKADRENSQFNGMTIRELLQKRPDLTLDLMTPGGFVHISPEKGKELLNGAKLFAHPGSPDGGYELDGEDVLKQRITSANYDVRRRHIGMITDVPEMKMSVEQVPSTEDPAGEDAVMQMGGMTL